MLRVLMHGPSSKDNRLENMSPPLNNSIIWDPPVLISGVNPTDCNRDSEYCLLSEDWNPDQKKLQQTVEFSTVLCPPNTGCIPCHRTSRVLFYTTVWSLF